jgi:methyltransferase (TIGR00027 family)
MGKVSQTAIFAAQVRAAHALLDSDPIFEDPYALALAGTSADEVRELFAHIPPACARVARVLQSQRARFVDEAVEDAVRRGVDQYIMLGAGLESFAWRRPDLLARTQVFEVDRPAMQEWKQGRLESVGLHRPPNLQFVGIDLATGEDLEDRLAGVGYDRRRPSIWSWLGVVVYLPLEAVESTLRRVATMAAPGSRLIVSYTVTRDFMDHDARAFDDLARAASAAEGEAHLTFLTPGEIESLSRGAGWADARSIDPATFGAWFSNRNDGLTPVHYEWLLEADR